MKVWINREVFELFKEMQEEGRTREMVISTFPQFNDDREIEVQICPRRNRNDE